MGGGSVGGGRSTPQKLDEEEVEEGATKPYGIMVAKADMEELFTILRGGSPVKVLPPND